MMPPLNRLTLIALATISALSSSVFAQQAKHSVCLECQQSSGVTWTQPSATDIAEHDSNFGVPPGPLLAATELAATNLAATEPTTASSNASKASAAFLPLLLLPIFGLFLWRMLANQNKEQEGSSTKGTSTKGTSTTDTALNQQPSHFSLSSGFVNPHKIDQNAANKNTAAAASQSSGRTTPKRNGNPDFNNIDYTFDSSRSPVDFLYESKFETSRNPRRNLGISALCETEITKPQIEFDLKRVTELLNGDNSKPANVPPNMLDSLATTSSTRMAALMTTRPDNLTKIRGLGKASQKVLVDNQITSFEQVASMTSEQLAELFGGRQRFQLINTSTWADQAREFAAAQPTQETVELDAELELFCEIVKMREMTAAATRPHSSPLKAVAESEALPNS